VRFEALVGGDARYGGLYDLLGVGRDYDSDRLIAVCGSAPGTHGRMVNASTVIVARKTEENS